MYRKGNTASELRYTGHTLSDNRHGLIANAMVTPADGHAEREAAKLLIQAACEAADDGVISITLGADKGYDATEFIDACQDLGVISHVAQNKLGRRSAVSDSIAASEGYALSQRKLIEQPIQPAWEMVTKDSMAQYAITDYRRQNRGVRVATAPVRHPAWPARAAVLRIEPLMASRPFGIHR